VSATPGQKAKIGFWLRDLPPASAQVIAEHTAEGTSRRATGTRADRDDLSDRCYQELMANAETRLIQDVARLDGQYARVSHMLYDTHLESR
jgi:hypothetical protein